MFERMRKDKSHAVEIGSTSVYVDLGDGDAAAMQRKASMAAEIARGIQARRLTLIEASQLLGIDPEKMSEITRGKFRSVSEATLRVLVSKLNH
jgi:predicted XRE-type DNA-binding protein